MTGQLVYHSQVLPCHLDAIVGLGLEVLSDCPVVAVKDGNAVVPFTSFDNREITAIGGELK